jgi:hypothetical protein
VRRPRKQGATCLVNAAHTGNIGGQVRDYKVCRALAERCLDVKRDICRRKIADDTSYSCDRRKFEAVYCYDDAL